MPTYIRNGVTVDSPREYERPINGGACAVEGCDRPAVKRGWCARCYRRWQRYGTTGLTRPDLATRFWSKVERGADAACWLWLANINEGGYGTFYKDGKTMNAHRVAYELSMGPIPDGLTIDHLCRNTACVNPAHLEPVTMRENLTRGHGACAENARKARCNHGHPLEGDNVRYFGPENRWRRCRTCERERVR